MSRPSSSSSVSPESVPSRPSSRAASSPFKRAGWSAALLLFAVACGGGDQGSPSEEAPVGDGDGDTIGDGDGDVSGDGDVTGDGDVSGDGDGDVSGDGDGDVSGDGDISGDGDGDISGDGDGDAAGGTGSGGRGTGGGGRGTGGSTGGMGSDSGGTGNDSGGAGSLDPICGDAACNGNESCVTCAADCGECPTECGDDLCEGSENEINCWEDCSRTDCDPLTLDTYLWDEGSGLFSAQFIGGGLTGVGDSSDEILFVQLETNASGSIPLSAGASNFVELDEDLVSDTPTAVFGSIAGEIVTGPAHAPASGALDVTLSDVTLLEYSGGFVPGGRCYSLSATLDSCGDGVCGLGEDCTSCEADCGACAPECGDGLCEAPENEVTCWEDCERTDCASITMDTFLFDQGSGLWAAQITGGGISGVGTSSDDVLFLTLDTSAFGTLELSAGAANFLELNEDIVTGTATAVFASIAGAIVTGSGHVPASGQLDVSMTGVTLLEYSGGYLPGGRCYSLTATLDGCGDGTCGPGEDSSSCSVDCVDENWTCDPDWFGDGACDCGCGAFDAEDCSDATQASCVYCDACSPTTDCASVVNDTQNWLCEASAWTCDPSWQNDGYCDCGCGAFDAGDCADATQASCQYCDACNPTVDCASVVSDTQNWLCE